MSYTHHQTDAANVWYVNHNTVNLAPAISVWIEFQGNTTLFLYKTARVVDENNLQIFFSQPIAGVAIIC